MDVSNPHTHSVKYQNFKFQNISFAKYQMLNQQTLIKPSSLLAG